MRTSRRSPNDRVVLWRGAAGLVAATAVLVSVLAGGGADAAPRSHAAASVAIAPASAPAPVAADVPVAADAPAASLAPKASVDELTIDSFDAVYDLGRDADRNATLTTTETIVADFPDVDANHGITRALVQREDGVDYDLHVTSVTDGSGHAVHYSSEDDDQDSDLRVLKIGDADSYVHGQQTYVIRYTSRNVVKQFADTHDSEFYWDVNGTGWDQAIGHVSATAHLQDGVASDLNEQSACYQGAQGSTDRCTITRNGSTFTASVDNIGARATMTIAIGFATDAFAPQRLIADSWGFSVLPWVLLVLMLLAIAWAIWMRARPWRDAKGRGIIVPQYTPPTDAYPALSAELLRRGDRSLTAQIVSFAVRKIVHLEEYPAEPESRRYGLTLLLPDGGGATPEEVVLLKSLFGGLDAGTKVVLDRDDRALGDRLATHAGADAAELRARKLRMRPKSRARIWVTLGTVVVLVVAVVNLFIAAGQSVAAPLVYILDVVTALGSIVALGLSRPPNRLTDAGADLRDYLYGLRDYIRLAEVDRIAFLQSPKTAERIDVTDQSAVIKLYERVLPYAIIFGLEREWIGELQQHYATSASAPDWYTGSPNLAGLYLFSAFYATSSFATTPTQSSWSGSSGSSGFGGSGGGGFSGGGGGGGGGGGW